MNSVNGLPRPPGLWQEARNPEGRVYYYNTQTKATQWIKPIELMTPAEVRYALHSQHIITNDSKAALANQPYKEYTTPEGRKYWYNTETKASSWEMPEVYKNALAQSQPPPRPVAP